MKSDDTPSSSRRRGGVYRKREFEAYIAWKSLPTFLKGQPQPVLKKTGIEDDMTLELLTIRTQTEFAARFGIKDLGTLTDWNKRIEAEGLLDDIYLWARKLTPNVVFALYKNVSKNGKAKEVKAWFELIENI
tara:strand:- start:248 stop:643 length:396 start_codon:yes stop_codon:yes gene_type:complete